MPFESNVFINCPFDDEYRLLLKPMIFTILYFELDPKISQTISGSNIRVNEIKKLIYESKFGIHDLSRCRIMHPNDLPRFNMPYELGLDIGCLTYGNKRNREKKVLILETEKYHYQKVLSDIAGQDIVNHNNDPGTLVKSIRNWLSTVDSTRNYESASSIWNAYNQCNSDIFQNLLQNHYELQEIENMIIGDYIKYAKDWIKGFRKGK